MRFGWGIPSKPQVAGRRSRCGRMSKFPAQPRPIGATILALLALILLAVILPATGHASPPSSGYPLAATSTVFPKTTVSNGSEKLPVELTNVSGETALVTVFSLEGPDASDFVVNEFQCGILAPGESCMAGLYFSPHRVGEEHATLRLDLYNQPTEYIELSGTGVPAELTFSPLSYDFGTQSTRESAYASINLTNSGEAPAVFSKIEIPNLGGEVPFSITDNHCPTMSAMRPGESCSLEVEFGPREVAPYVGELRATLSGVTFSAALSGEGGRPNVVAGENPTDLGAATVGGVGPVRTITLTNAGNLPAGFFIGIVAGGDAGSFRLLDEDCSGVELVPASSCSVHVRLAPQSPGLKVARLAFFGDGDNGTMVMLRGEGIAAALTLSPGGFDFGSQARRTKSDAHTFAVRNGGTTPVSLGAVAIVGANLDQFRLAGDECTGATLGPGEECLVRIRFAPATVGAKTATLRVNSESGALTATLSGLGAAPAKSGAADSRVGKHKHRARFRRGASLSAVRAR
jgi:hypothetical protein